MISVIIPTYNEEKSIKACLNSLLKTKNTDFEIIVIDDGSTDNSKFKVQSSKLQLKIKNLIYLQQDHKGPGAARNLGAKYAKGDILVFVDSDMTFSGNFLQELTEPIKTGTSRGTFTKNEFVSNWDNVWARCWNYNQGIRENRRIPLSYPDKAPVFRAILKKEFDKVNGFSSIGYTDDWSISRKLGYQADSVDGAKCFHNNPATLEEVYEQARWIGKNEFLVKNWRKLFNLIRYIAPVSLVIGIIKAILYQEPNFIKFKLVYDQAVFISILQSFSNKTLYK